MQPCQATQSIHAGCVLLRSLPPIGMQINRTCNTRGSLPSFSLPRLMRGTVEPAPGGCLTGFWGAGDGEGDGEGRGEGDGEGRGEGDGEGRGEGDGGGGEGEGEGEGTAGGGDGDGTSGGLTAPPPLLPLPLPLLPLLPPSMMAEVMPLARFSSQPLAALR